MDTFIGSKDSLFTDIPHASGSRIRSNGCVHSEVQLTVEVGWGWGVKLSKLQSSDPFPLMEKSSGSAHVVIFYRLYCNIKLDFN